jgi:hemin uptake protein HemP
MDHSSPPDRGGESRPGDPGHNTPVADSTTLLSGHRELIIRHGADTYRLRVTASNKLILTK